MLMQREDRRGICRETIMAKDTLSVTDNRTGKRYEIPIEEGNVIRATALREIKTSPEDFGMMSYDPALVNTATCKSRVTFIDGDKGILRYRGYPIEELAEKSNFLEVAYLIVKGELPDKKHFATWEQNIKIHTMVHENIKQFMEGFRHDAHPMGMLLRDRRRDVDLLSRREGDLRPGVAPAADPPPDRQDSDAGGVGLSAYARPALRLSRQRAELHRQLPFDAVQDDRAAVQAQPGAGAARSTSSSSCTPITNRTARPTRCARSAAPIPIRTRASRPASPRSMARLHGGANEAVIRMLMEIGSKEKIPGMIKAVKAGDTLLQGFGHRVYKNYDPRAKILKKLAYEVFEVTGRNPLIDVAIELERIALEDDYFIKRKLYPNVDFYSGIIYQAMGFPMTMFPVLFAIARTAGWLAQWAEMVRDPEQKITRPRQIFLGEGTRHWMPIERRPTPSMREDAVSEAI